MKYCSNCYSGCTSIHTDKCLRYTGPTIELLGINHGDSLSYINSVIIGYLTSVLNGSSIKVNIADENMCEAISDSFPDCGEITIVHVINAMSKAICTLQNKVDETDLNVGEINQSYNVLCVSDTLLGDEGTHAILQATINRLCALVSEVANLDLTSDNKYVKVDEIEDIIGDWATQHPPQIAPTGFSVVSSNPVQSIAVGSDGVASVAKEFTVTIEVYKDGIGLAPTSGNANPTTDLQFLLETPASPAPGISVTKITNNTLKYTIPSGTTFVEETVTSNITVKITAELVQMNTSFSIVPVFTADDHSSLELLSSTNVVKFDTWGNLVGPSVVDLQAVRQGYAETVIWETIPPGVLPSHSVNDTIRKFDASSLFAGGREQIAIKISTPNGLWDQVTILKVQDGAVGPPGAGGGSGYVVTSTNPVQSIAVGSDGIASLQMVYDVVIRVFADSTELTATSSNANPSSDSQFLLQTPASPLSGITVTKPATNTLRFTVANGTVFPNNAISSVINILATLSLKPLTSNFSLIPVFTAEDNMSLSINTTSTVVKYNAANALIGPSTVTVEVIQQNYTDTIVWETTPPGLVFSPGANSKIRIYDSSELFSGGRESVTIKVSTANGLWDQTTIVKVKDGEPGAPGLQGTTGMIPRLMEWVPGASYEINGDYIDYVYFRTSNPTHEGWYTVKIVPPGNTDRIVALANVGTPNLSLFEKQPFTSNAQFGTVIAEQANIAGFIFRNQVLTSQAKSNMICEGVITEHNNLTIDGVQGIIKFLERMQLDKNGIVLKDDCQRPRMKFQWDPSGSPVLEFLDENGLKVWEAGQGGYVYIETGTRPSTWGSYLTFNRIAALSGQTESLAVTSSSASFNTYIISDTTLRNNTATEIENALLVFQKVNCGSGGVTSTTPYFAVYNQTAFSTIEDAGNGVYRAREYTKGDMAADINNYNAFYRQGVSAAILESDVATAPPGTFIPDGWYTMERTSGENRNHSVICSATKGVYMFFEKLEPAYGLVEGYYFVNFVYVKSGRIIKEVSSIYERTWDAF